MARAIVDHSLFEFEVISSLIRSPSVELLYIEGYAVMADYEYSGGSDADLWLEVSNDNSRFVELKGSRLTVSTTDLFMWNVRNQFYRYVRLAVEPDSGSITVSAKINGKAQG